jgi:cell division protein FtsB
MPKVELGPYFLIVSLVTFVILITVITLISSTRQVTKGYVLNSLETKHQELTKGNEVRDMEISQVRSLNYVQNLSQIKRMVRPGEIVFINPDNSIAKK